MRVVSIVGARPQFIKVAGICATAAQMPDVEHILIHTGQHYDPSMSAVFFAELGITEPAVNLEVGGGPHGEQTGRTLERLEKALLQIRPDHVLVFGDTNSTLAGGLCAAKMGVRVGHVEAGLRSGNRSMPEEINRIVVDHLSDRLYAPTDVAARNLAREGIPSDRVFVVGDVMYDVCLLFTQRALQSSTICEDLGVVRSKYVLATVHRAQNTDDPVRLENLFRGLSQLARTVPVLCPLHPRTRAALAVHDPSGALTAGIRLIEPVGYLDMLVLEKQAGLIATDSGGVQREAFFLETPCAILRDETEWPELVDCGYGRLVPPRAADSVEADLKEMFERGRPDHPAPRFFGQGDASRLILETTIRG